MTSRVTFFAGLALLTLALSMADAEDPSPLQEPQSCHSEGLPLFRASKFLEARPIPWAPRSPGTQQLGISMARIDFGIGGLNPPHNHPRGTEILLVLEGTLYVGFVTSNQLNNTLFAKVLNPGDVFVFPIGMVHFQLNVGKTNAVVIAALSSQNPGVITIANALFNAKPPISPEVLAKGFQVDEKFVEKLQKKFW